MSSSNSHTEMTTSENGRGSIMAILTLMTYIFGRVTLNDVALGVAALAGLTTIALNVQKFFMDRRRYNDSNSNK